MTAHHPIRNWLICTLLLAGCSSNESAALPASCPEPVVLVHGTFHIGAESWGRNYLPTLTEAGCDVTVIDLPNRGYGDIRVSAEHLARHVRQVVKRSPQERVDLLTHSQGGLVARWFIRELGGTEMVDDLVMLAPPNHGTALADLARGRPGFLTTAQPFNPTTEFGQQLNGWIEALGNTERRLGEALGDAACGFEHSPFICTAAMWQMGLGADGEGSAFIVEGLNAGEATPGPVDYTVIYSKNDQVIVPNTSPPLPGPITRVTNVAIQDFCAEPGRRLRHVPLLFDAATHALVMDAFAHAGPAEPTRIVVDPDQNIPAVCGSETFTGADDRIDRDFDQFPRARRGVPTYPAEPWPDCVECQDASSTKI